ncbi:AAA family ATPase [Candidatus Pacearchaeota archaeon]|nr:AAA family ATPase [Candidatus Pacearchaeota archaeon]
MVNPITLKIAESLQEDVNKGIARLSSNNLNNLSISSGDLIEVGTKDKIVVKVLRSDKVDDESITLDGTTRQNINSSIENDVTVKVAKVAEAKMIVLSPLQEARLSEESSAYMHSKYLHRPFRMKQQMVIFASGQKLQYIVSKISPKGNVIITGKTKFVISEDVYSKDESGSGIFYEDIGGLKNEIELVREMVELPMKNPEVFQKLGVGAPKGVLLTGPPGTGKTLLARAVASETDSSFYSIAGPEIMSKYYGESEKHIRDIFEKATKNAPSIIFIDEIDSIAPKRGEGTDQTEKRIVAQLLTLMDGLKSRGQVVVMAATNRPDDIDEALRRPGRFDRELKINPPDEDGRREILQIHTRGMPLGKDVNFEEISMKTIGYTGADLEVLTKEAGLKAIKPHFAKFKNQEKIPAQELDKIKVNREHFLEAMKQVEPSAMREVLIQKPHVKWSDVGGLEKAKEKLRELVELPLLRPDLFEKAGIKPAKGVLLHGPPGTGKTLLAKAVATETNANFISVKGPELISKWVGESEKHVREIFKKARQVAPSIIFFDEFDSISKQRGSSMNDSTEKVVNQLLTELDGVEELEKVIVIAATNRRDLIDPSLLRPGRIEGDIELSIPDEKTREKIFEVHTKNMPLSKSINFKEYISNTEGFTGADIEAIARNAGINSIKRHYKNKKDEDLTITKEDFDLALKTILDSRRKNKDDVNPSEINPDLNNLLKNKEIIKNLSNKKEKKNFKSKK